MNLVFSDQALVDLEEIQAYTEKMWGEKQFARYRAKLDKGFHLLLQKPALGKTKPGLPAGVSLFGIERHFVIYTVESHAIRIVRILHQNMDTARHLQN